MANDINQVTLIGRLTRDAELKHTGGGTAVCKFAVAVNRSRKNGDQWQDEAHFFDIVVWGRQGEAVHQYLTKGKQVGVLGELRQNRWQDNSGNNRSKVEIHANNIQLLGGKDNSGSNYSSPENAHKRPSGSADDDWGTTPDNFEDDIPF